MKKNLLFLSLIFLQLPIFAQNLFIDNSFTAEQMIMDFFDNSCVLPSNIVYTGSDVGFAYFEGANSDLGINAGIAMTSGNVEDLPQSSDAFASSFNNTDGDSDLNNLVMGIGTSDAAVLEFDLTVMDGGELNFQYIFGSEEYPEFVGSAFNDAFAFFVEGPGLPMTNIAMVPNSTVPVAINNVNANENSAYFVPYADNGGQDLVLDGITTELFANFVASSNETYHVKIVIGDVADGVFDSAIFLGIESLCGSSTLSPVAESVTEIDGNTVTFTNTSRYATSWSWDFGDNETSNDRYPSPHTYQEDGTYTITLTTENWCCTDVQTFEVQIGTTNTEEQDPNPFDLYPNPANDYVYFSSHAGQELSYQLSDLTGKIYLNGQTDKEYLNVGNLPTSVYLIQVVVEGRIYVEKLIIQ